MPKISVCVPTHKMQNRDFFLERLKASLDRQIFKDYELVVTEEGRMAENSNAAIKKAKGEIVKVLYMDDYFYNENALQRISEAFDNGAKWVVSGCIHDNGRIHNPHYPKWNENIKNGVNTIGSPSVLAFINKKPLLFDERMSWTLDCDLYQRLYERYGEPTIINHTDIAIGLHSGQTTNLLTSQEMLNEQNMLREKYAN